MNTDPCDCICKVYSLIPMEDVTFQQYFYYLLQKFIWKSIFYGYSSIDSFIKWSCIHLTQE